MPALRSEEHGPHRQGYEMKPNPSKSVPSEVVSFARVISPLARALFYCFFMFSMFIIIFSSLVKSGISKLRTVKKYLESMKSGHGVK